MPGLSARQQALLDFVTRYQQGRGFMPSMREIADALGYRSVGSVHYQLHELDRRGYIRHEPNRPRAFMIRANRMREPLGEVSLKVKEIVMVPVLGRIAAGRPMLAEENLEDTFPLPRVLVGYGEAFLLRVVGDSMIDAAILDGDWVAIRSQAMADDGQMVAALIDEEATVKVLRHRAGHVWLEPRNPNYAPVSGDNAAILGVVVAVVRRT
jgi:repressor LexA